MFFLDKKWVNTGVPRQEYRNDMLMNSGAAPRASVEVFWGQTILAAAGKELLGGTKQGNSEESTSLRSHLRNKEKAAPLLPAVPWLAERQLPQLLQVPKEITSQLLLLLSEVTAGSHFLLYPLLSPLLYWVSIAAINTSCLWSELKE